MSRDLLCEGRAAAYGGVHGLLSVLGVPEKALAKLPKDAHRLYGEGIGGLVRAGVSEVTARRVQAALELGRRSLQPTPVGIAVVTSQHAAAWFRPRLEGLAHEELHMLCLSRTGIVVDYVELTSGSDCATILNPRQIIAKALTTGCTSIVLGHNHPSGSLEPSEEDKASTQKVKVGAKLVGLSLLDHLIFGGGGYHISMREAGYIS